MAAKIVRVGELELWTEGLGSPSHAPLLLVMGANASAMYWPDKFIAMLVAGGRFVIRYDHRDTGRSSHRDFQKHPYAVVDLAEDAIAVLEGYGIERAHVVGLSMGGSIGQILAVKHREHLHTLTVMMTAALDVDFVGNIGRAFRGEVSPDGLPTPDPRVLQVLARRGEPGRDREAELTHRIEEWRALCGDELPFIASEFRSWEEQAILHAGTDQQPLAHAFAAPFPAEQGSELRGVTTPTLVIQASRDPLNPPPHGRHLAEMIPGAQFVEIPRLGHALPSAVHRQLADLILDHTQPRL